MDTKPLRIGELSRAAGLSIDTIRYYEREGILPKPPRDPENRYRAYSPEHVETVRLTRRLRDFGLGPEEIRDIVGVFHSGTCRDMREHLLDHIGDAREQLRVKIRELQWLEGQLQTIVEGLNALAPDERRLSTLTPCSCVEMLRETNGQTGKSSPGIVAP